VSEEEVGFKALDALLRAFGSGDPGQVLDRCTPDVVFEMPFLGLEVERPDFLRIIHGTTRRMEGLKFTDLVVEALSTPHAYLARYRGSATVSGRDYRQRYITRFEVRDGLVSRFAEHFDTAAMKAVFAR
jgi:ketosteroid isomerase-like protein